MPVIPLIRHGFIADTILRNPSVGFADSSPCRGAKYDI